MLAQILEHVRSGRTIKLPAYDPELSRPSDTYALQWMGIEPNPFGGTLPIPRHWLEVVDRAGGHVVVTRISPFLEHLRQRWVKVGDFNAQGRALVFYHGFDGNAGSVPVFAGIRGWTGTVKRRLWSYAPP